MNLKLTVRITGFGTYDVVGEDEYETEEEARKAVHYYERLVKAAEEVLKSGGTRGFDELRAALKPNEARELAWVCRMCRTLIRTGEQYHEVRLPTGVVVPVHEMCMNKGG